MKAIPIRTGPAPVHFHSSGSRRPKLYRSDSVVSLNTDRSNYYRRASSGINISGGGGFGNRREVGEYYERMLKNSRGDWLLLRNYGKYLHEVVGDLERAEECYGRAILAAAGAEAGGDGEVLALYGRLIWERERDEERAKGYFDRAVSISPHDCTVLGSYAHFMWEAEEDEEDDELATELNVSSPVLVPSI